MSAEKKNGLSRKEPHIQDKEYMLEHTVLRIAGTVEESIVDGPGLRYVLFTQGCPHGCPGCHNPETHGFSGGVTYLWPGFWQMWKKIPSRAESPSAEESLSVSPGLCFCWQGSFAYAATI